MVKYTFDEDKRIQLDFNLVNEMIEVSVFKDGIQYLVSGKAFGWPILAFPRVKNSNEHAVEAFYRTLKCFSFQNISQFSHLVIALCESETSYGSYSLPIKILKNWIIEIFVLETLLSRSVKLHLKLF
jgi:hypothetical protein